MVDRESIVASKRNVFDANGNLIKIVGETQVNLTVKVGNPAPTNFTENFVVIRDNNLDIKLLFGMNILKYATLNFNEGTVTFNDNGSKNYPCKMKLEVLTQVMNSKEHSYTGDRISALMEGAQIIGNVSNKWKLQEQRNPLLSERAVCRQYDSCDISSVNNMVNVNESDQIIDNVSNKWKLQEQRNPLLSERAVCRQCDSCDIGSMNTTANLHVSDSVDLQANAVNVLKIKAPQWCKEKSNVVVCKQEHVKKGLIVGNALTTVNDGYLWVHIINVTNNRVTLKQGSFLCKAHELSDSEIEIVRLLNDEEHIKDFTEGFTDKPKLRMLTKEDIECHNPDMVQPLLKLLNEYRSTSWIEGEDLGQFTGDPLTIDLKDDTVIVNKPAYRIPHSRKEVLNSEIDKMLQQGVISRSKSAFNSPIILVPKGTDGGVRLCVDFRELNKNTISYHYPIPRVDELLHSIGSSKIMSSIDLAAAYHQCTVHPDHKSRTAFTVNASKFEWNRVPFGLVSAPGYFCRIINEALIDVLEQDVLVYMDDILVFSKDEETHLKRLEAVLAALSKVNLKIKVKKCSFFTEKIKFLGYTVTPDGMTIDDERVKSIRDMPDPTNKKQLQSFLGVCNYFRSFIKNYADIAEPLYLLLRKNVKYVWTESQSQAVEILKAKLCQKPILQFPDFNKTFHIYTDASLIGISACLMQVDSKGFLHPIAYIARSLSETQRNYSTTKRELLALVYALEQFRHLLLNYEVQFYTDHLPLLGILSRTTKDAVLHRWVMLIQEYKINLNYLPGKMNIFSDTLSRLVDVENNVQNLSEELLDKLIDKIKLITDDTMELNKKEIDTLLEEDNENSLHSYLPVKVQWTEDELKDAQNKDVYCNTIRNEIKNCNKKVNDKLSNFKVLKGILYVLRRFKRAGYEEEFLVPYIPETFMKQAFKLIHSDTTSGHRGYRRTLMKFRKNFYNASETKNLMKLCENCEACIKAKAIAKPVPLKKYPIPEKPFTELAADILGPFKISAAGNRYVLVVRDFTTRMTLVEALPSKDTDHIIEALRRIFSNYGTPEVLLTDNAQEFISEKMIKFCQFFNIRKREVTVWHPSSNGLSERANKELNKLIRIYVSEIETQEWDTFLPTLQLTINSSYNESLGDSPFFCLFGYDSQSETYHQPRLNYADDDLSQRLNRIQHIRNFARNKLIQNTENVTKRINKTRKYKNIQIGDKVFAKLTKFKTHRKMDYQISGPYAVTGKKGNAFILRNDKGDTYVVHPDFIINKPNATLLDREDNNNRNDYTRDESNATLSSQGDVDAVSVSSRIAKRAITETPSHTSITDITTQNVGKEQLPPALSNAHEHKIWPYAPISLPISDTNTTPIGTIYHSANAAVTNTTTAAQRNAANAAQNSASVNASNVTHTVLNGSKRAHALSKAGDAPAAAAKVTTKIDQDNKRVVSQAIESETSLANSRATVEGSNAAVQRHRYNLRPRVPRI